jgi:hypothetical protein
LHVIGGGKIRIKLLLDILFGYSQFEACSVTEQYITINYLGAVSIPPTSLNVITTTTIFLI